MTSIILAAILIVVGFLKLNAVRTRSMGGVLPYAEKRSASRVKSKARTLTAARKVSYPY